MNAVQIKLFNTYLRFKSSGIRADIHDKFGIPWTFEQEDDLAMGFSNWQCYTQGCMADVGLRWSDESTFVNLNGIFIHNPRYWGRGVGSILIDKVKAFTIKLGKDGIVGWVSDEQVNGGLKRENPQPHLLDWYRHHGFSVTELSDPSNPQRIADIFWRAPF